MKTSAVIAEYNPFHNGHKYQIDTIKKIKNDPIIVIMSGNFTQRGTPSIINKFKRAETAVLNGANLVLELPVIYSSSNAEIFAKGAVYILNSLGIVDNLFFGSEDNINIILNILEKLESNKEYIDTSIKKYLEKGYSYLKSYELSLDFLDDNEKEVLKKPNNILAFEYIKAINLFNSSITPNSILRKDTYHGSSITTKNFSSASNIRDLVYNDKLHSIKNFVPQNSFESLENKEVNNFNNYFNIFKYLLLSNKINFNNYYDYEDGLENRLIKYINSKDIYEFINNVSSKRYTKARISRLINNIILDVDKNLIKESFSSPAYIRILAMDSEGRKIIKSIENENIINKFSKSKNINNDILQKIINKQIESTNIYNLFMNKTINEDFIQSPIFIK